MSFRTELAAVDAARNCRRRYCIEAGRDLLGAWLVTIAFGRLGTRGRTIVYIADDEPGARRLVETCLRRRASAPRRIGVGYTVCSRSASPSWSDVAEGLLTSPAVVSPASA